jgi:uncharacterized protein
MAIRFWLAIIFFLCFGLSFPSHADNAAELPVIPWNTLRYRHVERQLEDFTCGAASLSTIIRHFIGKNVSERDVLRLIKSYYSDQSLWEFAQKEGFSLLDLQKAANDLGFSAEAYRLTLSDLAKIKYPVIVHLNKIGYKHFSVVKGVSQGRVWLSDPIRGNVKDSIRVFAEEWSGVVLVVWDPSNPPSIDSALAFSRDSNLGENDLRRQIIKDSVQPQSTYNPFRR